MRYVAKRLCIAAGVLMGGVVTACTVDRVAAPVQPSAAVGVTDEALRSELRGHITSIRQLLAEAASRDDREMVTDSARRVRALLKTALAAHEQQLTSSTTEDWIDAPEQEAPSCMWNGNLDACFLTGSHSISLDGTGGASHMTSVSGSQSAVITITDNGMMLPSISVSELISSQVLSETFTFSAPDCNVAHKLVSQALHTVSMSVVFVGGVSGVYRSPQGGAACSAQGLTVAVDPPKIGKGGQASITVTGLSQCVVASVTSSNTSVATVQDYGYNNFVATEQGEGTTTITATCGFQKGSAMLTVEYAADDEYLPSDGGGDGAPLDGCPLEDTYDWYRNYNDGTGWHYMGTVCLSNNTFYSYASTASGPIADGEPSARPTTPSTIILARVPSLPRDLSARITRNRDLQLIEVPPQASGEDLTLAVGTLGLMRALGAPPMTLALRSDRPGRLGSGEAIQRMNKEMRSYLAALANSPSRQVQGHGDLQAVEIPVTGTSRIRP